MSRNIGCSMVASKSPRNAAWEGLKRLSLDRAAPTSLPGDIYHWGILARPASRNPRDDRASALVATAVVEQALEHAIGFKFCRSHAEIRDQMFDGEGAALKDLSSKTKLAYMMGIIGKNTRSDLSAIRRIRNAFAHSRLRINFDTPEITAACAQISLFERWTKLNETDTYRDNPRELFLQSCIEFSLWLLCIERRAKRGKDSFQTILLEG